VKKQRIAETECPSGHSGWLSEDQSSD